MIVKRTVFAMQEVTAENGYESIMEEQAKYLGNLLFVEDAVLRKLETEDNLPPEMKANWLENMIVNFVKGYGEEISFNTDLIVFEKDVAVNQIEFSKYAQIATTYMTRELGKVIESRNKEYINFIKKVLRKYTECIHFKIIKICGKEYSLFTF